MTKRLLVVICSLLLLGAILLGAGLLGIWLLVIGGAETPGPAPAVNKNGPELNYPQYEPPMEITIEDVPEVPKEILGPSPPIEKSEE